MSVATPSPPPSSSSSSSSPTTDTVIPPPSLSLAHEGVRLVMTNQFNTARAFFTQHSTDPRVSELSSLLAYLNAISSHAEGDLTTGLASVWATESFAKKRLSSSSLLGESIEGQLIQADCHMLGCMIQFVQQSYVKVMWNIRKSYQLYHQAEERIERAEEERRGAEDDDEDDDGLSDAKLAELKGWMQFGVGMFNLVLSLLPPTVLKVAEWVGYGGDRDRALSYLKQSQESPSFMSPFACLLLLSYFLTISTFTGQDSPAFLTTARSLLDWAAIHYPQGAFFALMESRYYRSKLEPRKAIDVAKEGLKSIKEMPQVSIMFVYQCGWCALFLLEWEECAAFFDQLLHTKLGGDYVAPEGTKRIDQGGKEEEEHKTPATEGHDEDEEEEDDEEVVIPPTKASAQSLYAYQCGLCYALAGDLDRARWYLRSVPSWLTKRNKAIDLYAVRKAHELLSRPQLREAELVLDLLELFIAWNGLIQTPAASIQRLTAMLNTTHQAMQATPSPSSPPFTREDLVRYLMAEAAITALTDASAARDQVQFALKEHEKYLERSQYAKQSGLLAFLYYELANDCLVLGELQQAKKWQSKSKSFTGHDLYDILQLKLHALAQRIKRKEDEEEDE